MLAFLIRRLLTSALLVLALLTLVFFVIRVAPGDPLDSYLEPDVDPRMIETLRTRFGFDEPLPVQYVRWMRNVLVDFDFGISISAQRPVRELVAQALPNTLRLGFWALCVRFVLGIALGTWAAMRRGRSDAGLRVSALFAYSVPGFWLGIMLILAFAWKLRWFPPGQMQSLDHASLAWSARLLDDARHLVLPVIVLGVGGAASTLRYMRAGLLEVLSQDYVRAARAKGLREHTVVMKHAMRNALLPVVTLLGLSLPGLVGGTIVIEQVFSWPGMGTLTLDAIAQRDYPVIMATTFLSGAVVVLGNLLTDLTYAALDPRIRLES
jgi:peptide/nickel transport system permease protein